MPSWSICAWGPENHGHHQASSVNPVLTHVFNPAIFVEQISTTLHRIPGKERKRLLANGEVRLGYPASLVWGRTNRNKSMVRGQVEDQ